MTDRARHTATIWWRRRFPPLTRVGWNIATFGDSRPTAQTLFGFGLMGAGLVLKRNSRRKVLYRGYIKPGTGTHIRVYKGNRTVYDGSLEG
ncbi:MAG: hypothetical protein M3112_02470 [Actinomycetia bacterium]|nr:hypothetical protein [Actinomycetes bacterium]